jgi:hypothetical protein
MKQTAVEWLYEIAKEREPDKFDWDQAKQIEIDQRKEDFRAGWYGIKSKDWNCEYYMAKHLTNDFKSE